MSSLRKTPGMSKGRKSKSDDLDKQTRRSTDVVGTGEAVMDAGERTMTSNMEATSRQCWKKAAGAGASPRVRTRRWTTVGHSREGAGTVSQQEPARRRTAVGESRPGKGPDRDPIVQPRLPLHLDPPERFGSADLSDRRTIKAQDGPFPPENSLPQATRVLPKQRMEESNVPANGATPVAIATKFEWLDWSSNRVRACLILGVLLLAGTIVGLVLGIQASQDGAPSPELASPSPELASPTMSPTLQSPSPTAAPTRLVLEQLGQTLFDPGTYSTQGPRGERLFGWSVDLSSDGKRLAATAPYCNCVFIYDYSNDDLSWTMVAQIENTAGPVDHIAISGDGRVLVLGIPEPDDTDIGGMVQAYHQLDGSDTWQELGGPILGVSSLDRLGGFVDDDGVAGPCDGQANEAMLSRDSYDSSTLALSEDGKVLAMGSARANYVRVLRLDDSLSEWVQFGDRAFLVGEEGCDNFGTSVDISGDGRRIIVGAPDNIGNALPHYEQYNGNVRVFEYDDEHNTWVKIGQDIDGIRGRVYYGEHLGTTVSISQDGSTIAVAASPRSSDDSGLWDISQATEGRNGYAKVYIYILQTEMNGTKRDLKLISFT